MAIFLMANRDDIDEFGLHGREGGEDETQPAVDMSDYVLVDPDLFDEVSPDMQFRDLMSPQMRAAYEAGLVARYRIGKKTEYEFSGWSVADIGESQPKK